MSTKKKAKEQTKSEKLAALRKAAPKKAAKGSKKPVQKAKPKKAAKASKPAPRPRRAAGVGHNSGINAPLVEIFEEDERLEANKKEISKAQRDLRAKAKAEHGITKKVYMHELNLRKLDPDVRADFEMGHADLKDMIGYEMAEGLLNAIDTEESGEGEEEAIHPTEEQEVEEQNLAAASSSIN